LKSLTLFISIFYLLISTNYQKKYYAPLQNHLSLLREEYVKLQNRLAEVEKKYQIVVASSGQSASEDNFVVSGDRH
jgi:hypothetical protein